MNTIDDTLSTLGPDAREMAELVMDVASRMFADFGEIQPACFTPDHNGPEGAFRLSTTVLDKFMNPDWKPFVWDLVRIHRQQHRVVGVCTEVWIAQFKGKEWDGKTPPSQQPNREEMANFVLWEGKRTITFMAKIMREPNKLGEWKVFFDSQFPSPDCSELGGAMMEGEPPPSEGN